MLFMPVHYELKTRATLEFANRILATLRV